MKPIGTFVVTANLPQEISALKELAYNYWWCWSAEARDLFNRIDRKLWDEVHHNPVLLLNKLSQERLIELAKQPDFLSYLELVYKQFTDYLSSKKWFDRMGADKSSCIAYFSAEYGINESFPNYSGGLGILAGDHLKSSSDVGLPLIGVGLLYQQGYFRQHLTQNGWQNETYITNDFYSMPLTTVRKENGEPLIIEVNLPQAKLYALVWKLQIGNVPLYLMDTNINENPDPNLRNLTDQLYGGDRDTRIQQEILLGIGGMRALQAMNIKPSVVHINEGHAAFALLERAKFLMEEHNIDFRTAKELTRAGSIFTTHTPVPAGNEAFETGMMEHYFKSYFPTLGISYSDFIALGQEDNFNPSEKFSMTILGLRMSNYHNGVSKLHGEVSRHMWQKIWRNFPVDETPIDHVTNGIHTLTWLSREFYELFNRYLPPRWKSEPDDPTVWKDIEAIPSEELWREKQRRRMRLIMFARKYLQKKQRGFMAPEQITAINEYLDPDALTIGFARRFATYKRATLLFSDMERLKNIVNNTDKPIQILIAGKAHPHDIQGKETIQSIIRRVHDFGLERRILFLEDYDMVIGRLLVKGCDVWLNNPRRPLEASGTSGMKAGLNGTLNMSILDGWWDEAYNEENGFAIGHGEYYENELEQDLVEAGALYELLEQVVVPMFYERNKNKVPERWVAHMKSSIASIAGEFSTSRMVKEYANKYYIPAHARFLELSENNAEKAINFRNWKQWTRATWEKIHVVSSKLIDEGETYINKPITVQAIVNLSELQPDDVDVQVYYGSVDAEGDLADTSYQSLSLISNEGNNDYKYEGAYACQGTGMQGYTIRVMPANPLLVNQADLYVCTWQ